MAFLHSGNFIRGISLPLALWSYLPLYVLPFTIGVHLIKVPIEVCHHRRLPRRNHELMSETTGENPYQGPGAW